jgi:hypothetical protein
MLVNAVFVCMSLFLHNGLGAPGLHTHLQHHISSLLRVSEDSSAESLFLVWFLRARLPLWSSGQNSWLQIQRSWVRFPALPDFLRSGSVTGSTQPREDNWGATWMKSKGSGMEDPRLTAVRTRCPGRATPLYPQKLVLTSPTSGRRSADIISLRTKSHGACFCFLVKYLWNWPDCWIFFPEGRQKTWHSPAHLVVELLGPTPQIPSRNRKQYWVTSFHHLLSHRSPKG